MSVRGVVNRESIHIIQNGYADLKLRIRILYILESCHGHVYIGVEVYFQRHDVAMHEHCYVVPRKWMLCYANGTTFASR